MIDKIIKNINIPRQISNHLFGKSHSLFHRMIVGAGVMVTGVLISKSVAHADMFTIHIFGDGVGYLIHGIGAIPFGEYLMNVSQQEE